MYSRYFSLYRSLILNSFTRSSLSSCPEPQADGISGCYPPVQKIESAGILNGGEPGLLQKSNGFLDRVAPNLKVLDNGKIRKISLQIYFTGCGVQLSLPDNSEPVFTDLISKSRPGYEN